MILSRKFKQIVESAFLMVDYSQVPSNPIQSKYYFQIISSGLLQKFTLLWFRFDGQDNCAAFTDDQIFCGSNHFQFFFAKFTV